MASANAAVFLRRNNQVQDAIDGQNLKQALQLVEKRIKKGEDTVFLKAWKAHILFLHADDAVKQRGIQETLKLCDSEPPVTDTLALEKLFQTLKNLDGHSETRSKLWENATRAKPQDREIQLEWFFSAFECDDWRSAQKAAMSLQKNFPQKREYFWWAIALSYQLTKDEKTSESERKLFGTLAYRMASKAAADVPSGPDDKPVNPRAIQTVEEMRLLIRILESQKRHVEAVEYLNSKNLGLDSEIVRGEKSFLGITASNLIAAGLWDDGLAFVRAAYKISDGDGDQARVILGALDLWELWQLLIDAHRHTKVPGMTSETRKFLDDYLEFMPKSRNASLASIGTISVGIEKGEATREDLFLACKRYIDCHSQKLYVFSDLCQVIDSDKTALSQVLAYLFSGKEVGEKATVPSINALKFAYYLTISGSEGKSSKQQIESFVANCMKIYKTSSASNGQTPNDVSPESSDTAQSQRTDDLCILAAMALLRTDGSSQTHTQVPENAVIRAAAILEHLLSDAPDNYEARLVLVRAYLLMGAGSLALKHFSKLSVKQVQSETVAHNVYTRISTIHPHSAPPIYEEREYRALDPQASMIQSLNFYRASDISSLKFRARIFEEGGYVSALDSVKYRNRTNASIVRRIFALDVRRIQRLIGGDTGSRYIDLARDSTPIVDNRKYDGFPNCEFAGTPDFEERLRPGPLPKANWLASARVTDRLFSLLKDLALRKPLAEDPDLPNLQGLSLSEDKSDQTEDEKEATGIHRELFEAAVYIAGSKTTSVERADNALVTVADYLESKKKDLSLSDAKSSPFMIATALCLEPGVPLAPTWRYLHSTFTLLETLKVVSQLASLKVPTMSKLSKDHVQRLSTLAGEIFELVMSNTRAMKQHLSAPGVLGKLIDLVMHGDPSDRYGQNLQIALDFAMDESAVELFVGSLMESWEEALDGALKVKHAI